jgi:hypothetical protein
VGGEIDDQTCGKSDHLFADVKSDEAKAKDGLSVTSVGPFATGTASDDDGRVGSGSNAAAARRAKPHKGRVAQQLQKAGTYDGVRLPLLMPLGTDTVVLLGAGASQEAGIPMSVAMTSQLVNRIGGGGETHNLASALHYVCGAILAYDAADGKNPLAQPPDVERVFAAIRLLEERRDLEVTPFVASWHPAVDAWDKHRSQ